MKFEGMIASKVKILPKGGAAFKVSINDLGDTFPVFQNEAGAGVEGFIMGDKVNVEFSSMYANKAGQIQLQDVVIFPVSAVKAVKVA